MMSCAVCAPCVTVLGALYVLFALLLAVREQHETEDSQ